jgi:flagellin
MAMTQTIEGALNTISDMYQRIRELAIQSANATNSSEDRSYLQQEVNQLIREINRVSTTSKFNGETILDGSFVNKTIQLGMEQGEQLSLSVPSIAASEQGAYIYVGHGVDAAAAAGTPAANALTENEDLTITGAVGNTTITASTADSAKATSNKINAATTLTGVSSIAQTYGQLSSSSATTETYSLKINGVSTGNFSISSSSVEDAVRAINAISGSSGVTAQSTTTGAIKLFDNDGDDITVENETALANLSVQKLNYSGTETVGVSISLAVSGGNDSTRVSGSIKMMSSDPFGVTQAGTDSDNVAGVKTSTPTVGLADTVAAKTSDANLAALAAGPTTYKIAVTNTGATTDISVAAATADGWNAALDATILADKITATEAGGKLVLTGIAGFGDFELQAADASAIALGANTAGVTGLPNATYQVVLANGGTTSITVAAATAAGWQAAIDATDLVGQITATVDGNNKVVLTGTTTLGDFTLNTSNGDPIPLAANVAGEEGQGLGYFVSGTASLDAVSNITVATQASAGTAITACDAALTKVAAIRADLGAIENRLTIRWIISSMSLKRQRQPARGLKMRILHWSLPDWRRPWFYNKQGHGCLAKPIR